MHRVPIRGYVDLSVPLSCDYFTSQSVGRIIDHRRRFPIRSLCHRRENTIGSYVICGAPIARLGREVNAMATLSSCNKNGVPRSENARTEFLSNCCERRIRWRDGEKTRETTRTLEEDEATPRDEGRGQDRLVPGQLPEPEQPGIFAILSVLN